MPDGLPPAAFHSIMRPDGIADLALLGLSDEAIAQRRLGVGCSDLPAICGDDAEKLAEIAAFKQGAPSKDLSDLIFVQGGNFIEPFSLAWAEWDLAGKPRDERGRPAVPPELRITRRGERVICPTLDWLSCTLDGWRANHEGANWVVQAKWVNAFSKADAVQARYMAQATGEAHCTGADGTLLVVLYGNGIGGDGGFAIYPIEFNPSYAAQVLERAARFWEDVQAGREAKRQAPIAAPPPVKAARFGQIEMTGHNAWAMHAAAFLETKDAHSRHEQAKKDIKTLMPPEKQRAWGHGIEVTASTKGALTIKPFGLPSSPTAKDKAA